MTQPHPGELLLGWMSAHATGTILVLTQRILWLSKVRDLDVDAGTARRLMRYMAALGYIDMDWATGRWRMIRPTVVLLPDSDGTAIITGAAAPQFLARSAIEPVLSEPVTRGAGPIGALLPRLRALQVDDSVDFANEVRDAGLAWAGDFARRALSSLSPIMLAERSAPPASGSPVEELVSSRPRTWRIASNWELERGPGLYRRSGLGRPVHLYKSEGRWWKTDLAAGLALELHRRGEQFLAWSPEKGRGRGHVGRLSVSRGALLPPQHERAAVLCSGVAPSQNSEALVYENVPRTVALRIAASLHQPLVPD
ncbi:hypothetical protein [Agrococcus sp. Marseille-Q4369]|uniref:hypothetical protein n=1 Tax=Agrococcus sp. Marseille-Q4369 TaxID=2810513 RepID=UPI001B8A9253|nr:hypothetical protein [Agrococcus sp. Marseille-Q4369]QUW18229.1 hypothetical protein JSQ78_10380 [Agrococcus sp. Marseille-Q4369]